MEELGDLKNNEIFSTKYKRKKLIKWLIRTIIAGILFVVFWDHEWALWALYVYIPLNLIGLAIIFLVPYYLKRKQENLEKDLNEL